MVDGRAATINWANKYIPAIVHAWFPGEFMGNAIAKVLFGDYNPGGRLAVTFPKSVGQVPFAFPFKARLRLKGESPCRRSSLSFRIWFKLYDLSDIQT